MTGHSRGEDWEYFTMSSHCLPTFLPQGDGTFELVLIVGVSHVTFLFVLRIFRTTTGTTPPQLILTWTAKMHTPLRIYFFLTQINLIYGKFMVERTIRSCCQRER